MFHLKDFVDVSAMALGIKPEVVSIPFEVLQAKGELGGQYAYNRSWVVGINRAKKDLGFQPTAFSDYVATTACWFRDCWEGDRKKLLTTRPQELALAKKWKDLVSSI
jgi:nucleoside-diphosphate-sugar epimerase